jgi:hypothetical protein
MAFGFGWRLSACHTIRPEVLLEQVNDFMSSLFMLFVVFLVVISAVQFSDVIPNSHGKWECYQKRHSYSDNRHTCPCSNYSFSNGFISHIFLFFCRLPRP